MEFEVEEDLETPVAKGLDEGVASRIVEFHAYLEPLAGVCQAIYKFESRLCGREVEGDGEAVFWVGDERVAG
jgi:hypothetical protein